MKVSYAEQGRLSVGVPVQDCELPVDAYDRLEWWRGRREVGRQ